MSVPLHIFVSKTARFVSVVCFPKGFAVKSQDGSLANLDIGGIDVAGFLLDSALGISRGFGHTELSHQTFLGMCGASWNKLLDMVL